MATAAAAAAAAAAAKRATGRPVLHNMWVSSCSWRVRAALAVKGVEYEYRAVSLADAQRIGSPFAALNAAREVPVLEIDGLRLAQSAAIIEYVDATRGGPRLLPQDPAAAAHVRTIAGLVSAAQTLQNGGKTLRQVAAMVRAAEEGGGADAGAVASAVAGAAGSVPDVDAPISALAAAAQDAWGARFIRAAFDAVERVLETTAGECAVGDDVTMADCFLVPQVFNARTRFKAGVDMGAYPTLAALDARLRQLPAFVKSHPKNQVDAPRRDGAKEKQ